MNPRDQLCLSPTATTRWPVSAHGGGADSESHIYLSRANPIRELGANHVPICCPATDSVCSVSRAMRLTSPLGHQWATGRRWDYQTKRSRGFVTKNVLLSYARQLWRRIGSSTSLSRLSAEPIHILCSVASSFVSTTFIHQNSSSFFAIPSPAFSDTGR